VIPLLGLGALSYGRWFYGASYAGLVPGPIYERYHWRPALVAFFGFGGGMGRRFGFGNMAGALAAL